MREASLKPLRAFLFAVFAAVDLFLRIGQDKDVRQFLLDRSDAPGIFAFDDILDFLGQHQLFFLNDLTVLDDIDGDGMIDEAEDIQIQHIDVTLHLEDVLFSHFIAAGVLDDRHGTVQFVQLQMMVDGKAHACFDVIEHKAFFDFSYI